jgi:hypothetical protein
MGLKGKGVGGFGDGIILTSIKIDFRMSVIG